MTAARQRRPVVLLRPVPGDSVIHRLWAGTKLIVVFAISMLLSFYPGWIAIGLMAVLVVLAIWLARIPRGVLPSVPRWLYPGVMEADSPERCNRHGGRRPATHDFTGCRKKAVGDPPSRTMTILSAPMG